MSTPFGVNPFTTTRFSRCLNRKVLVSILAFLILGGSSSALFAQASPGSPRAHVTATPNLLWPPNHRMVTVSVDAKALTDSDPSPVCEINSVSSNETGEILPEASITGPLQVSLRAERRGNGNGRIYTVFLTCTHESSLSASNISASAAEPMTTTESVTVTVPHDQSAFTAGIPSQWIAKQYSEGLGRGPDPAGWKVHQDFFEASGCSQANLKDVGRNFLTGGEFESKVYDNAQRVFVAYRAIFSREPDQDGFDFYLNGMNSGAYTWAQLIDEFYDSAEFGSLVSDICGGSSYRDDMGANRPIAIGGQGRNQATLQDDLSRGGEVCLNPQEVIYLTSKLTVPATATLRTCAAGDNTQTAKFGRLIRDAAFPGPMVEVQGTIDRVWIDGQRGQFGFERLDLNVDIVRNGVVTNSRIAEPRGATNVKTDDLGGCVAGTASTITFNLITAYTSSHAIGGQWADGLSLSCSGTTATDNFIIDATDVGIVVFARGGDSGQNIFVARNKVLAAGRSAFAAFVVCDALETSATTMCTDSVVRDNQLWTSSYQHFDIGLAVGTQPWEPGTATGGETTNNFTPTDLFIRVKNGIVVDGVTNHVVQNNVLATMSGETDTNFCVADGGVVAHTDDPAHATASSMLQPYTQGERLAPDNTA